jgi:hypothetical protein
MDNVPLAPGSLSWLDGAVSRQPLMGDGLPLTELRAFGWVVVHGMSPALISPLGALGLSAPIDGKWTVAGAITLHRPRLGSAGAWAFVQGTIFGAVDGFALFFHHPSERDMVHGECDCWYEWTRFALRASLILVVLPIVLATWRADAAIALSCRAPLPLAAFEREKSNLIVVASITLAAGLLMYSINISQHAEQDTEDSTAKFISVNVGRIVLVVFLFYEALLCVWITVASYTAQRRASRKEELLY